MRELVSAEEMKAIDRRSIQEFGIPSMVLMERAALEVAREAERILFKMAESGQAENRRKIRVLSVCGFGNNGADGIAAGRMLFLSGFSVTILLPDIEGRRTPEFQSQLGIAKRLGIPVFTAGEYLKKLREEKDGPGTACDLLIDAVFGVGLSRDVEGAYKELLDLAGMAKADGAKVVAVDIPSGISSDTGRVLGTAVAADVTVTFGKAKIGQILFPGREYCGRLIVADAGFVPEEKESAERHILSYEKSDLSLVPKRKPDANKGSCGKVLVIAGTDGMAGAAYFSALAAYRCGAGLVKIFTPKENRPVLQERLPEAILACYDAETAAEQEEAFRDKIREQTDWADVIVLGPGIGRREYAGILVETVLSDAYVPIILDADALNIAAADPSLKRYFTDNLIVTPHILEMARLTGRTKEEILSDTIGAAVTFSEQYGLTCVLKDAATVTVQKTGRIFLNASGSPSMAKGGSGDVLCGVIAGLMAIGMDDCEAASLGVYIHGLAGERAALKYGVHGVLAGELADCAGEVLRDAETV